MRSTASSSPRFARNSGLTLIEILVVVAVLAVLAGAAVPVAVRAIAAAARRATRDELTTISNAALEFFRDTGSVPQSIADLEFDPRRKNTKGWVGPYVPGALSDPQSGESGYDTDAWSRPYCVEAGPTLHIASAGENGDFGDDDDIAIVVDFTPIRREKTLEKLRTIDQAITLYNSVYHTRDALPVDYRKALTKLVSRGFLPDYDTYLDDAWGKAFAADPEGRIPLVRVQSVTLSGMFPSSSSAAPPSTAGEPDK